ncbi:glycosyltransferase family protein, partial [Bacteroides ovatus]
MKFLFIVQGEGRGHFTQAITLEEMLLRNGHEVVEVLVGKSSTRTLPGFFNRSIHAPVKRFISPNFLPTADNKRANLTKSFAYNLLRLPEYLRSMYYINQRIRETGAEVVINFYELLTGLTYALFRPSVPYICVGHQYLFLHRDFEFPDKNSCQLWMLRFFTRMTALRSSKKLALSFLEMEQDD